MAEKTLTKQPNSRILWIKTNPVKFLLFIILLVLPLIFIILLYLGTFFSNNKFSFTEDGSEVNVTYTHIDDLPFELHIYYKSVISPTNNQNGSIVYTTGYTRKDIPITSINVTYVIHTNWIDTTTRHNQNLTTYSVTNPRETNIPYNHDSPLFPLWLVKVTPDLYLKLVLNSNGITSTYYVSMGKAIRNA